MIDWTSDETHLLLNPRLPEGERQRLEKLAADAPPLPGHLLLATSGTTGSLKLTALSKRAMLISAAAVNRHLGSTAEDLWCCVLPTFHVGGLGIYARAHLSGARVVAAPWDAREFVRLCREERVTLASLVPAQVRDLAGLEAPSSLRAIVVGGGAFRERVEGWPLLPSYGMTECCSQVATARPGSGDLLLLDHVEARQEEDGRLALRSEALLSGYLTEETGFADPKRDGWFVTEDVGRVEGAYLRVEGRLGDFVKIGGESVDLGRLDRILASIAGSDAAVFAVPDTRLGHVIHLAVAAGDAEAIAARFDREVLPFERARAVHRVPRIPRSALGKLMRKALLEMLPKSVE
ncbi:MAG TPA: AMP-binding protein [Thermoanaerobaculia bacterium]